MEPKQKIAVAAVLGIGAVGLIFLLNRGSAVGGTYSPTASFAAPNADVPTYQAGNITIAPAAATAGLNPAQNALTLNFLGGDSPIWGGLPELGTRTSGDDGAGLAGTTGTGDGCGCGCGGSGGGCGTNGATTDASGTLSAFSTMIAPFMQKLAGILPSGTVAADVVDPGAPSNIAAAINVWQRQNDEIKQAGMTVFPPGFGPGSNSFG